MKSQQIFLELGQIIQIFAPSNPDIDKKIYLIEYLDDNLIKLINDTDLTEKTIEIINGELSEQTIETINIITYPDENGYAKQNNFIPNNWITVEFGGEIPIIINGQITDIDEDEIEISEYQTEKKYYINFDYKGIPLDIPIKNIRPFIPPEISLEKDDQGIVSLEKEDDEDIEDYDDDLELIIDTDFITDKTKDIFINVDDIEINDESLGEIKEMINVKESNKRYGIETQTQDILDELLSEYPSDKRTNKVLNNIHTLIERFKQLRRKFSDFDEAGNAEKIKIKGDNYKPLIQSLKKLNKKISWLLPVVRNSHKLYDINSNNDNDDDIQLIETKFDNSNVMEILEQYKTNSIPDEQNKYNYLIKNINGYFTPFSENYNTDNIITKIQINRNLDTLVNNYENFISKMVEKDKIKNKHFLIDRYNIGINKLTNSDIKNRHNKSVITSLTNNETINLLGFLLLERKFIQYSKINLNLSSIYQKSNLHKYNFFHFLILNKRFKYNEVEVDEGELLYSTSSDFWATIEEQMKFFDIINDNIYYNFQEFRKFVDREEDNSVYDDFLNTIIPNTKNIFTKIFNSLENKTSYIKIIEELEPFLIYNEDITYEQYKIIADYMDDEIYKLKTTINQNNGKLVKYLRNSKSWFISTILPKLIKKDYKDIFDKKFYNINNNINTELSIKKILDYDNSKLFHLALSLSQLTFSQPIDIEEKVYDELDKLDEKIEDPEMEEKNKKCKKQYNLVKRYIDIDELSRDNNSPCFVDKKYDDTPYDIGEEWKLNNSISLTSADNDEPNFELNELTKFLIENNGIKKEKAIIDAKAMLLGSKEVKEGDYAYLDIGGDIKYYVRQDNIWKYDKNLSGHPNDINFCNIKDNCLKIKETCTNLESTKEMLKIDILENIAERFQNELNVSIDKLKGELLNEFNYHKQNLQSLKTLKIKKLIKKDLLKQKISNSTDISSTVSFLLTQSFLYKIFCFISSFINILSFINFFSFSTKFSLNRL